jgi:hypothetical protein
MGTPTRRQWEAEWGQGEEQQASVVTGLIDEGGSQVGRESFAAVWVAWVGGVACRVAGTVYPAAAASALCLRLYAAGSRYLVPRRRQTDCHVRRYFFLIIVRLIDLCDRNKQFLLGDWSRDVCLSWSSPPSLLLDHAIAHRMTALEHRDGRDRLRRHLSLDLIMLSRLLHMYRLATAHTSRLIISWHAAIF